MKGMRYRKEEENDEGKERKGMSRREGDKAWSKNEWEKTGKG